MKKVDIQIQDISGKWFTVQTVADNDQMILGAIESVQQLYKKPVRALSGGSVVQFWPYIP